MAEKKQGNAFIRQAGILAAAGIIVRIIGILYRSPLTAIIGDTGNGYYTAAYNLYTIILLVSSYSIPSAISKVISQRLALQEYRNAQKIFQCAVLYVVVVGGIASLFTFFGAGFLTGEHSAVVLRFFAPTIFFSGLLGVLRGYFQAHRTMLQTSFSQILEQIFNAVVSIGAAYGLMQLVQDQDTTTQAVYGAVGSALGTGTGVVAALLFMVLIYQMNRKMIHRRLKRDTTRETLDRKAAFRIILFMVTPVILSTFIYNFSTVLNQTVFVRIMHLVKEMEEEEAYTLYGIFSGKAVVISNIPIAIASAMSAAVLPTVAGTYAKRQKKETNRKIASAIRTTMYISIPAAVGMTVLAKPIVRLLFPQKSSLDLAAALLMCISVTVIFYGLSTVTNAVLQGIGKVNMPVVNAAIALAVQTIVLFLLLYFTEIGLYGLCIAMIVYSGMMCVLNQISVRRCLGYRQELVDTFLMPLWCALVMGAAAAGVYYGLYAVLPAEVMGEGLSNVLALVPAIGIGAFVYFAAMLKFGVLKKKELRSLPKGMMLERIARKLRLIR